MTKRYTTMLRAICIALVVSLMLAGELLEWPPQVLVPAGLAIFGVAILLQVLLDGRAGSESEHRRTN